MANNDDLPFRVRVKMNSNDIRELITIFYMGNYIDFFATVSYLIIPRDSGHGG